MKEALLIVGHGSRSKEAQVTFETMVEMVRERSNDVFEMVKGAHMELAKPSIEMQVEALVNEDVSRIYVVPYFLYKGIHIKEDIPELLESLKEKYPKLEIKLGRPIGLEPKVADVIINRAKELC